MALPLCLLAACGAAIDDARESEAAAPAIEQTLARWDRDAHADIKAVVVMRHGAVIAERYYNGDTPETLHDIRSAGKSVTALLVGAAIERGQIRSVSDRVDVYLTQAQSKAAGSVRIEDLLTMRSGLEADDQNPKSLGNEERLDASSDPFAYALSVPRQAPAGQGYVYNSLTAYLAGVVVAEAVGEPLDAFAEEALFGPLGIRRWQWNRDASGRTKGQGNLSLTARDFAKIGQLMLDRGTYDGKRVLNEQWMREACQSRVSISAVDPYADGYGYYWYSKTHRIGGREVKVCFASGNGGNKIYVIPSLDLVVAITSSAYGRGYGQRRSQDILKALLKELLRQPRG